MEPFVCSFGQRSHTKVKGHQRSNCRMDSTYKIHLIWKVKVRLEPNLVYWYNVGTFTCSWGQRSQMKVKGHVRSICKVAWKFLKKWLICMLEDQLEPCDPNRCGIEVRCQFASSTNRDSRWHYRKVFFIFILFFFIHLSCLYLRLHLHLFVHLCLSLSIFFSFFIFFSTFSSSSSFFFLFFLLPLPLLNLLFCCWFIIPL